MGCLAPRGKIFVLLIHPNKTLAVLHVCWEEEDVSEDELRHLFVSRTHQWHTSTTSLGRCHICCPQQTQTPHLVTANLLTRGVSGQSHISALCSGHQHVKSRNRSMDPSWQGVCSALTRAPTPLGVTKTKP